MMKGQMTKSKKSRVTSTPFNPSACNEKTRNYIPDGSYLDISRNLTVGQQDIAQTIVKNQRLSKNRKPTHAADRGIVQTHSNQPALSWGCQLLTCANK